ncbi:hypothetical protein [Dyella silvatica]|nr:hypothetical protein [Dyella silvatica]
MSDESIEQPLSFSEQDIVYMQRALQLAAHARDACLAPRCT